jgi:hypothetical protein
MMEIDKDAVNYLVAVAKDAGFDLVAKQVYETVDDLPRVELHLKQTRIIPQAKQEPEPIPEVEEAPTGGITEKQAAELAKQAKKMLTLDGDE